MSYDTNEKAKEFIEILTSKIFGGVKSVETKPPAIEYSKANPVVEKKSNGIEILYTRLDQLLENLTKQDSLKELTTNLDRLIYIYNLNPSNQNLADYFQKVEEKIQLFSRENVDILTGEQIDCFKGISDKLAFINTNNSLDAQFGKWAAKEENKDGKL